MRARKPIAILIFASLAVVATAFTGGGAGTGSASGYTYAVTGGTAPSGPLRTGSTELDRALDCQRTGLSALSEIPGMLMDAGDAAGFATVCTRTLAVGVSTFGECVARLAREAGSRIVNDTDGTPQAFVDACQNRSDEAYTGCVSELRQRTPFTLAALTEACGRSPGPALRACLERRTEEFRATDAENDLRIGRECVDEAARRPSAG